MEQSDFYKAGELSENPFRQNPDMENDPRADVWVGFPEQKVVFLRFLEKCTRMNGRSAFLLLYGTWGTGKSHALLWARHQILHKQAAKFNSVAYYMRTLKVEDKVSFGQSFNHFLVARSKFLPDILAYRQWLMERISEWKTANSKSPDFTYDQSINQIFSDVDFCDVAKRILRFESREDLIKNFEMERLKDYRAMSLFATIVKLFTYPIEISLTINRFKNAAYLLIDELDDLDRASAKERLQTNDLIRDLYDQVPSNFCLVGGISLQAADLDTVFPVYVTERIKRRILMSHLQAAEAKTFLLELLAKFRIKGAIHNGFYPFEDIVIDAILARLPDELMTPRKIIEIFDEILEGANDAGFDFANGPISLEFLEDRDVIEDALEA